MMIISHSPTNSPRDPEFCPNSDTREEEEEQEEEEKEKRGKREAKYLECLDRWENERESGKKENEG